MKSPVLICFKAGLFLCVCRVRIGAMATCANLAAYLRQNENSIYPALME
jgi:hypothetical protein